mgnify:CR=1 FL=1
MRKRVIFENFISENLDRAYGFAFTYMKNREDAEDVVSESVTKALESINSLREENYVKTWFYRIIANTAKNVLRKKHRFISVELDEKTGEIAENDDYSDIFLRDILDGISEKYREIVVLKYCENMTFAEIAEVCGINENTAKTRLYAALRALRRNMEGKNEKLC